MKHPLQRRELSIDGGIRKILSHSYLYRVRLVKEDS
jgi:hypothetical protein